MSSLDNHVTVRRADVDGCTVIEQMMQFYMYDLSQWYPLVLNESGMYTLSPKADYWADAATIPYLIDVNDELAGFAVVDGDRIDQQTDFNLGYFFIMPRYRGQGVGKAAFQQIVQRHIGQWEIYFLSQNQLAAHFWPNAIQMVTGHEVMGTECVIHDYPSTLFRFVVV